MVSKVLNLKYYDFVYLYSPGWFDRHFTAVLKNADGKVWRRCGG